MGLKGVGTIVQGSVYTLVGPVGQGGSERGPGTPFDMGEATLGVENTRYFWTRRFQVKLNSCFSSVDLTSLSLSPSKTYRR